MNIIKIISKIKINVKLKRNNNYVFIILREERNTGLVL